MLDWWSRNGPPVYLSVAGYLGLVKPVSKKSDDLSELMGLADQGGMIN